MTSMHGRAELRSALAAAMSRHAADAEASVQTATVVIDGDELMLELDTGETLADDQFSLSQDARAYHRDRGLDNGDNVILVRQRNGGEYSWVVIVVISDNDPPGGPGDPSNDEDVYTHLQTVPSTVWHVVHGLGRYPHGITTVDSSQKEWKGAVTYISNNEIEIHFGAAMAGYAYVG